MAKRRKSSCSSDDFEPISDGDDQSYHPSTSTQRARATKKPRNTKAQKGKARQRPKKDEGERFSNNLEDETGSAHATPSHPVSIHTISRSLPLQVALLEWYNQVHEIRGMPWRKPYDPSFGPDQQSQRAYEVWVSEVMLQQTQVATVIPYYNNWMAKFPTIQDLAKSDIDTVNGLWKGLGYYSRAARLLSGAKIVVEELGGCLPNNAKEMESKIPGIGRYSAGAICSIAYNQRAPVLDGNVHRLLSRVLALHAPPKSKQVLDILWSNAALMVENSDRPGDINQALIELGSTICKFRDPDCSSCPLKSWCNAYQRHSTAEPSTADLAGDIPDIEELCTICDPFPAGSTAVTSYPMRVEKKKAREELDIVNVIEWKNSSTKDRWFLLVRRPEGGLLAGLLEFPTIPNIQPAISNSPTQVRELPHTLLSNLLAQSPPPHASPPRHEVSSSGSGGIHDVRVTKIKSAGDVTHIFSHIRKTYRVQWVVVEGGGDHHPPLLASSKFSAADDSINSPPPGERTRKGRRTNQESSGTNDKPSSALKPQRAMWVLIDDVPKANIGTGVLKVWKQVQKLWEKC